MTSRIGRGVAAAGVLVALAAAPLRGQQLRYTGSIGWASGSYTFTERTESFTLLNGLALAAERWSFSVTQPIVIQNTGSVTYVGGMQIPTGAGRQTGGHQQPGMGGTESGGYETVFGDPILRASVTPQRGGLGTPSLELQIMAKAPVADPATGVGTGEWDTG
ncbi:MAG: hypothetical protein GWM90_04345, partial [Gemmatimonadetes bacterium]|nr:hypothetical protein [Gemmatimonadota bacterium]NIQ52908.1 hypothetical protein [Gemmatimonadota bacterium]NIU73040.1 hypothetical protein [Gammaproteobacteria bacterium]NIX43377.1 hypothetical protein [Gemmatimonadota bacterium]NIY07552.1 hypothetical protein [Gemmatimonadota bacterium]